MDLLSVGWIRRLLVSSWFPLLPQVILLVVFGLLIAGGLGVDTSDKGFAGVLRNTNLANLVVWAYWWPAMLLGAAVLMSAVFARRAFCSYLCPIGHLPGLYSCLSPLAWRAKSPAVCDGCKTRDCIDAARLYRLTGRSCTSGLFPRDLSPSRDCLMCTQCLKACPNGNLRLSLRKPFSGLFSLADLRGAEVGFLLLIVGFLWYDIVPEVPEGKKALMWLPNMMAESLAMTGTAADLLTGVILFIGYPAALLLGTLTVWATLALTVWLWRF